MAEKTTLARPYAKAIYDLASESDILDSWSDALFVLAQVSSSTKILDVIDDPDTSLDAIVRLYTEICKDFLNDKSLNLISLAAENGRLDLLPEIAQEFEVLKANDQGVMEAEVTSAFAVNATQKKLIIESLEKRFNKKVSIKTFIDKKLLGGIIIRAGDLVIDGSVSNQLHKITHTLMR